jgi:hypothetical protein
MKKNLLIVLALAFFGFGFGAGGGAAPQGEDALKQATDSFMTRVTSDQADQALGDLLDHYWYDRNDLTKTKASFLNQLTPEMTKMEGSLGKALPKQYEFVGTKKLGKSVIRLVYIQKFENFFAPWSFTFYKAKDEFRLAGINFGDSVDDDMKGFATTEPAK